MKHFPIIAAALFCLCACSVKIDSSVPARIKDGKIVLKTPARPAGQQNALLLTAPAIDTVRVGFIGLGMRGTGAVKRFIHLKGAKVTALCDLVAEKVQNSARILAEAGMSEAACFDGPEGWKAVCESEDVDLVYICTDWKTHTPMAVYAMEHGKHVALEVPAAMSIAECWQLINTSERTRKHCMMLENCVYDWFEATVLNMAQHGLFGEIYHAEGGYIHNLDPYWDKYEGNWRMEYNRNHRGDNYPTHGIGPVCQVLNIHRGDRMDFLVSQDTDSFHGKEVSGDKDFADGDHTVTLIRTARGRQIEIQHNVYASRPYSRLYQLTGTEGFANKYPVQGIAVKGDKIEDAEKEYDNLDGERFVPKEVFDHLMEQYKPEIVKEIQDEARKVGGHGGMDFIMDYRLIYCLRNGLPLDQDVYDAAEWSCLTELSRLSIEHGSMPVEVPDFTRGAWNQVDGYSYAVKK